MGKTMTTQNNNNSFSCNNPNNISNTPLSKNSKFLIFVVKAITFVAISYGLIFGGLVAFKIAKDNPTPTSVKLKGNSEKDVKSFEFDFSI